MKAYVFLADGFEEIEAITPIDILKRAEIELVTVSISDNKMVSGAHKVVIMADVLFSEVDFTANDLILLPGGMPGTSNLDAHEGLKKLLLQQAINGKYIAAICAAPSILGKLQLLNSKEAVCYPGFENQLLGAIVLDKSVIVSGNIITAKGAGVALEFALKLVEVLKGKELAEKIKRSICVTNY